MKIQNFLAMTEPSWQITLWPYQHWWLALIGCFLMCIIPVRHKVKELIELVQDDDRLKQERKRAKKNRDKYKGVSSEAFSRGYSKLKDAVVLSWRAKKRARVYKYPLFVPVKILQSNNHAPFLMIQYFFFGGGGQGRRFWKTQVRCDYQCLLSPESYVKLRCPWIAGLESFKSKVLSWNNIFVRAMLNFQLKRVKFKGTVLKHAWKQKRTLFWRQLFIMEWISTLQAATFLGAMATKIFVLATWCAKWSPSRGP